ncbi:MAG: Mov34/MPN/PAD-1 family protein [Candidatus Hermodarchaeota archaeon]
MNIIENEYEKIIEFYPNVILEKNIISHIKIPLKNNYFLEINFKHYPKKPIVKLISIDNRVYRKIDRIIPLLNRWEKEDPPSIVDLINEILTFINDLESEHISIKKQLLIGILALCQNQHPKEILGLLRIIDGIATEYILPPGALTSKTSGFLIPSRLGLDLTLKGSIHSHPSGNPYPSLMDINSVFKTKEFNFIIAFPYNLNSIKCFNNRGQEIEFTILD